VKIFSLISAGVNALRKGEILAHPERWKTAQAVSMALAAVAVPTYSALCSSAEACYGISQDQITQIATLVGGIAFAVFQIWTTLATSEKVGIGGGKKPVAELADVIRARPIAKLRDLEGSPDAEQVRPDPIGSVGSSDTGDRRDHPEAGGYDRLMGVD
jgi:hypothetical protein